MAGATSSFPDIADGEFSHSDAQRIKYLACLAPDAHLIREFVCGDNLRCRTGGKLYCRH